MQSRTLAILVAAAAAGIFLMWSVNYFVFSTHVPSDSSKGVQNAKITFFDSTEKILDGGISFNPPYVKVIAGKNSTATWINESNVPVYLQSDEGYFNVTLNQGKSFNFTYNTIGWHEYHTLNQQKRGGIMVSTEAIESGNLATAELLREKSPEKVANIVVEVAVPGDNLKSMRLNATDIVAYTTTGGNDVIVPRSLCVLCSERFHDIFHYFSRKPLAEPNKKAAENFARNFMTKIGFNLDGSEQIEATGSDDRADVYVQQRVKGWIVPYHTTSFHFSKDYTIIELGRWYQGLEKFEFGLDQEEAKNIATEFMNKEVEDNPKFARHNYVIFNAYNQRVSIFDDKVVYEVPIVFKATGEEHYENSFCSSPQFLSVVVITEARTGSILGWYQSPCE